MQNSGLLSKVVDRARPGTAGHPQPTIAIVGAGFGGLGMAIQLQQHGYRDFTIFDKADGVGGVWRDNTYPGAACDVPSHLYSYSFERRRDWTRHFPKQPEILDYLETCVRTHHLEAKLELGTEIVSASWDEDAARWTITTAAGDERHFDIVIWGLGQLNRPRWPDIDGLDEFKGTIFHSARWNHDHDLSGERVGVIGNGASAVQFVPPVAAQASTLYQFQRSANWMLPKPDAPFSDAEIRRFRRIPFWERLNRSKLYATFELRFMALRSGSKAGKLAGTWAPSSSPPTCPTPSCAPRSPPTTPWAASGSSSPTTTSTRSAGTTSRS